MKRISRVGALVGGLVLASRVTFADEGCASSSCHAELVAAPHVHAAAESCDACHESLASPHPQKGKKTFKLTQEPSALCVACHDEPGKKKVVHPPVKEGMCTTCHDPHSSKEEKLLVAPAGELCGSCHSDHTTFEHVHGPVGAGECLGCHAAHESDLAGMLKTPIPDLCVGCHVDVGDLLKKKDVHPPAADGCTTCHNPHGSAQAALLADEKKAVCLTCHDAIGTKISSAASVHKALDTPQSCGSCHSPHGSDHAKLLPGSERDTCLTCHAGVVTPAMTNLHGPIRDGSCTSCHDPHASPNRTLLLAEFPTQPYAPYSDTEFALCFSCHDRDLVRYADTSFATKFRDGERNLHFVHVNKEKGRSCTLCHAVHGSSSPALIAQSVSFGQWKLPLKFTKTDSGGSCAPGCHKPQAYDRQNPKGKPPGKS